MLKTATSSAVALLVLSAAASALADPITDQIDAARQSYQQGEPKVAIQTLKFAAAMIEDQLAEQRIALLPAPLEGWSADQADSLSGGLVGLLTGTNLSRTYRQDASGAEVSIMVTADSPLLPMMNAMIGSSMLLQLEPGSRPYSYGGYRGVLQDQGQNTIQLTLMLGNRILLQLDANNGATQDMLLAYLKAMDLSALEKALLD